MSLPIHLDALRSGLSSFRHRKPRSGESGKMALRVLVEIRLKLLGSRVVLHRLPKGQVEVADGRFSGRRLRRAVLRASSRVRASEAKVPAGYYPR